MANVTMDIAELDALREEIKELKKAKEKLTEELYEVKGDKKVLMITKYNDVNTDVLYFHIPRLTGTSHNSVPMFTHSQLEDIIKSCTITPNQYSGSRSSYYNILPVSINKSNYKEKKDEKVFINFDDALVQLKEKVEKDFAEELAELRSHKARVIQRIEQLKTDHELDTDSRFRESQNTIKVLNDAHLKHVKQLEDTIKQLRIELEECITGKKERTKIEELEAEIIRLNIELSKPWIYKLFNT